jgi:hypothetical protein
MLVVIDLDADILPSLAPISQVVLLREIGFESGLRTASRGCELVGRASGELAHGVEAEPEAKRYAGVDQQND